MKGKKVFVAVPVYRELPHEFVMCWLQLVQDRDLSFELSGRFLQGEGLIPRARNRLTADFLATDCTHLLFIDCDLIFRVEDVERLATHDEGVVGGFVPIKRDGELLLASEALSDPPPPDERGLIPLRYIGGFLLVRRDVFEKMLAVYGDEIAYRCDRTGRVEHDFWRVGIYRPRREQPGRYLSEDWYFLQNAIDLGFKVYGDTHVVLKHIGTIPYPATSETMQWDGKLTKFVSKGKCLMETGNEQHEARTGRPTLKTPEMCAKICERMAQGETLTNICRDADMPAWTTVHDWKQADESFRQALMRAREQQAEVWAEEVKTLSDDELDTHEAIGRARLRMQSRQWLAGKYNQQFADKPTQIGVNVGVQVVLPEAERAKLIQRRDQALLANKGDKSGGTT
jgi:hypothetical protein